MTKMIETITTSILYLKFKENNENDLTQGQACPCMTAHGICFDF